MKMTKPEKWMLLLTGAVIVFFVGFFLRGALVRDTIVIETEKLPAETIAPAAEPGLEADATEAEMPGRILPAPEDLAVPSAEETEQTEEAETMPDRSIPEADGKLDLNRATMEELQTLPGIGPVLAERIVDYRTETGGFAAVSDLIQVEGIGEKTLEKLLDLVKVEE